MFFPPAEEGVQARQPWVQKPEGQLSPRKGGSGGEAADARSRERGRETRAARARGNEGPGGGVLGRAPEEGALEPNRRPAEGGAKGGRRRRGAG